MGWQRRGTIAGHKAREAGRPWPVVVSSVWATGWPRVGHVWAPGFTGLPMVVVGAVLITEAIETAELVVGVAILSGCRCGRVDNTRASLRSDCELHALHWKASYHACAHLTLNSWPCGNITITSN